MSIDFLAFLYILCNFWGLKFVNFETNTHKFLGGERKLEVRGRSGHNIRLPEGNVFSLLTGKGSSNMVSNLHQDLYHNNKTVVAGFSVAVRRIVVVIPP